MKRTILFGLALALVAAMPLGTVAAANDIDYEKSVGQLNGADTVNWVVDATSDGGYVVGGQTALCYRYEREVINVLGVDTDNEDDGGKVVNIQECIEHGAISNSNTSENESIVMKVCGPSVVVSQLQPPSANTESTRGAQLNGTTDDDYFYVITCTDYVAKFQKNGTKEWLTVVDSSSRPIVVGEIDNGYRMLTESGDVITVNKTGAAQSTFNLYDKNTSLYETIYGGKIEPDGSMVITTYRNVMKFSPDGVFVRKLDIAQGEFYYPNIIPVSDGYLLTRTISTDGPESGIPPSTIVKANKDLTSTAPVALNGTTGIFQLVLSSDKDDNVMIVDDCELSASTDDYILSCRLASFNKAGELIAKTERESIPISIALTFMALFREDFVRYEMNFEEGYDEISKVIKYDKSLKTEFEYTVADSENIFDTAVLDDGSLVGVGFALKQSTVYPVDGDMNGVYFRMTPQQQPAPDNHQTNKKEDTKNPNTFDAGLTIVMTLGGISMLGVGLAGRKIYKNIK